MYSCISISKYVAVVIILEYRKKIHYRNYQLLMLFFGTLHSDVYIFPFLLCFSLLFFSQLFVRPPQTAILLFCLLFRGYGLDPCLLYNVTNLRPQFIRHSVYQIQSLKSSSHFHCIILRDLIQVIPEWSSGFPYFLQFKSEFGNKEFMI